MDIVIMMAFIAGAFAVGMGARPLLQSPRSHKKSSSDVSISFLCVLLVGVLTWLSYGIAIKNPALIIGNSVDVLSSLAALVISPKWITAK